MSIRRVALFFESAELGGISSTMLALADGLQRRGVQVDVLLWHPCGPLRRHIPAGCKVVTLKRNSLAAGRLAALWADPKGLAVLFRPVLTARKPTPRLTCLIDFARYLRRERPDALLSGGSQRNLVAIWAVLLARVPVHLIISEHNNLKLTLSLPHRQRKWRWRYLPEQMRFYYPKAARLVVVSQGLVRDLAELTRMQPSDITTIYNPVVSDALRSKARMPLTHPWFSASQPPVILSIGQLAPQKDYFTLLRAFAEVVKSRPCRLLILGEGHQRGELQEFARALGVDTQVDFPGWVDNPHAYLSRAALFVLSSAWEGLCNALIEALAAGCPVVSTRCHSGPEEILENGRWGRLVDVGDAPALAAAIDETLDRPLAADRLQTRAADFSVDKALDKYMQLLLPHAESRPLDAEYHA